MWVGGGAAARLTPALLLCLFLTPWGALRAQSAAAPIPDAEYDADVRTAADLKHRLDYLNNPRRITAATPSDRRRNRLIYTQRLELLLDKYRNAGAFDRFTQDYTAAEQALPRLPERPQGNPFINWITFLATIFTLVFVFGGLYVLYRMVVKYYTPPADQSPPLSDNYGTAAFFDPIGTIPTPTWVQRGIFLGKSSSPAFDQIPLPQQPGAPVCTTPENHTLIVARTRTGKGTRVIIPTLLRYGGSMIVIDPKGENAAITARPRLFAQLAEKVHILNPWDELGDVYRKAGLATATFNPLDVLDRNDPNAVAVAQSLAAAVCPVTSEKDRYWQGSAANVFAAVLLWITDQPGETKTLARAREIVSLSRKRFTDEFLTAMAASSAFGGAIKEMVSPYLDLAQETYSGIMSNLSEGTKFLSDPQVKAATAASTFAMTDLIHQRVTVYLVIPPDRIDTQRTWLRLILTAASHTFKRAPLNIRRHRAMLLMDEFPALGKIEDMPRDIATMSGYGLDYMLAVQGIDQIKDLYGQAAGTILSNCAYKWFCNVNDLESAKYLSDTLGKKTVRTIGKSENEDRASTTYGETGRALLTPDEVLTLGRDIAIATHPHGRAHYLRPIDYWNLQAAFSHLAQSSPEAYWQPPLVYDPNPYYQAGEQRTVNQT